MKAVFISEDYPSWGDIHPRILAKINTKAEFEVVGVDIVNNEPVYKLIQHNEHYPQGMIIDCPIRFTKDAK